MPTTIDVGDNFWFVTVENTQATCPYRSVNMVEGRGYVIECGHHLTLQPFAKAANFAAITDDWTPVAVGDYIMLVKVAGGSIIELERCVNGVRSINTPISRMFLEGAKAV